MKAENKPQTASEKAEVMLAFDRGEKVEICARNYAIWEHDFSPDWDWRHFKWRVMAKPIEGWVWVHSTGIRAPDFYDSKNKIENCYIGCAGRAVFMREVVE